MIPFKTKDTLSLAKQIMMGLSVQESASDTYSVAFKKLTGLSFYSVGFEIYRTA